MDLLDRVPPQNLEAEEAVIGGILLDNEAAWTVAGFLAPPHFYRASLGTIYALVLELVQARRPADMVIVKDELARRGSLEAVGGAAALVECTNTVPSAANTEHYGRIVFDCARRRALIRAASEVVKLGYESDRPTESILDDAGSRLSEVLDGAARTEPAPISTLVHEELARVEAGGSLTGLLSHLVDLDRLTNGFKRAELVVLAARPSMGKTSLALSIARDIALRDRVPVAFFSLEMSRQQVAQNLLCQQARVDSFMLRKGTLSPGELYQLQRASGALESVPLLVDDQNAATLLDLRARARQMKRRDGIGLVVVDYLQLLEAGGRSESRQDDISKISRGLKALARELDVPVIALSQLSRAVESRDGNKPRLSDLRESGAIEQDADVVLLLYREEYYRPEREEAKGKAEVIVAKNRNGPTGSAMLFFQKEYTRFDNLLPAHASN